jgi:hypothetical protein
MKKSTERPIISALPPKEEKDWLFIRQSFLSSLEVDITNARLQLSFAKEWTVVYEERFKDLQALYRIKENYGK